jgi:hypothetical protein
MRGILRQFGIRRPHLTRPPLHTLQQIAVPAAQVGRGLVSRDEKRHKSLVGIGRRLNGIVGQNEFR